MQLEAKKYLYDMQQAATLLTDFTSEKSFDDYRGDPMLKSAVEQQFEIIGERGQFYFSSEGEQVPFRIRTPLCLSHHPAHPLSEEEVAERARKALSAER